MTNVSALTARWGLLLITLLLGASLVATGVTSYVDARGAAASTARVEANDLLQLRHDLRDAGRVDTATLERLLEESRPRGAQYVGVVARDGVLASAGNPGAEVTWQPPGPEGRVRNDARRDAPPRPRPGSGPPTDGDQPRRGQQRRPPPPDEAGQPRPGADQWPPPRDGPPPRDDSDQPAREAPAPPPDRPGAAPVDERPGDETTAATGAVEARRAPAPPLQPLRGTPLYRAIAWLEPPPDPRRPQTPADRHGPLAPEHAILVVDFEPVIASRMVSRALIALVVQVATTVVLVGAAVSFWRRSRREERARQDAERDRHLRTLGEMSAVLGHELRNPLASLKGHAQLLLERLPADHPGRGAAATVVSEAIRLEALANQVLEFVKTGTLDIQDTDPRAVLSEAVDLCGVDHLVRDDGNLPPAWPLDHARIVAVLVNLIKNARDASPSDCPIELRALVEHGRLVYEVLDRGEGLAAGEESRAFEPFYTTRVHGTGLGLALAKRVVEGHGGRILAANREGGGASFRLALPRRPSR